MCRAHFVSRERLQMLVVYNTVYYLGSLHFLSEPSAYSVQILMNSCSLTNVSKVQILPVGIHTLSVLVQIEFFDHGSELFICQVFTQLSGNSLQVPEADFARVIVVKQLEGSPYFLHGISIDNSLTDCLLVLISFSRLKHVPAWKKFS